MNNLLLRIHVCLLLLASSAFAEDWYSLAKLIVGGADLKPKLEDGSDLPADFYTTNLAILQSAALRTSALERARLTKPDVKETEVALRVVWEKDTRLFSFASKGVEPQFTRVFLDAVLDEFLAFRAQMREEVRYKKLTVLAEDIVKREVALKEKSMKLAEQAKADGSLPLLEAEEKRLVANVMELRNQGAATIVKQKELEEKANALNAKIEQRKALQKDLETSQAAYNKAFEEVRTYQVAEEAKHDVFQVLQRATPAMTDLPK